MAPELATPAGSAGTFPRFAVTLVIPVYNVRDYLGECLSSVASQSMFDRSQVIIVDDGSTDGSSAIAQAFAEQHWNVLLIRQPNAGLGAARNAAIPFIEADSVAFLDSDDRLPSRALEALYIALDSHKDVDFVTGDILRFPSAHRWQWSKYFTGGGIEVVDVEDAPELIHGASACNKLFRSSVFTEDGARFGEGVKFEDAYVTVPLMLTSPKMVLVREVVYEYRVRDTGGSIMDSRFTDPKNHYDMLALCEQLKKIADLPAARRALRDSFCVWGIQGDIVAAPANLSRAECAHYFRRLCVLFDDLDPEVVAATTKNLRNRIGFVAIKVGDFDLFLRRESASSGIRIVEGYPHLRVAPVLDEQWLGLLRSPMNKAYLEYVSIGEDQSTLHLGGVFDLPGIPIPKVPEGLEVTVELRGAEKRSFQTSLVLREERRLHEDYAAFRADVPISALEAGSLRPYLKFQAEGQVFRLRLRTTTGLLRLSRTLIGSGGVRLQVLPEAEGPAAAVLKVDRTVGSSSSKQMRALENWRSDFSHFRRKSPFRWWRLIRLVTRPFVPDNVWLLGERRDTAQDNGAALFRYLRTRERWRRAYYVISKESSQRHRLRGLGRVLTHGSLRHKLLMLHARVLISSQDIDAYLLPRGWSPAKYRRYLAPRVQSRRVFLQHGVTYNGVGPGLRRGVTGLDLFVCASPHQREYLRRSARGYDRELSLLGFPRFDALRTEPTDGKTILLAPTWRSYLTLPSYSNERRGLDPFEDSQYDGFYRAVLDSPRLAALLNEYDYHLDFLPHYEVAKYYGGVGSSDRISVIADGGSSLAARINSCSLFVTDYSSTFFDAAYRGVPVIYAPFDEEEFRARHYPSGWFDFERDGFGPVVRDPEALIDVIEAYLRRGCVRERIYDERANRAFLYRDERNCERVTHAISILE